MEKNLVIVLDTETANTIDDPLCYDIGWAVVNADNGEVIKTESYAVAEIFLDKPLMKEAYFAEKVPQYWNEIENGDRKLARLSTIRKALRADYKAYGISEIYAHNARFDYRSCNLTQRLLTGSRFRFFFPYGATICDTLKMSREAFGKDEAYRTFCEKNDYLTKSGSPRFTAEILYRFMKGDNDFVEEHKGIDDVLIEKEILAECRRRGVVRGRLWE